MNLWIETLVVSQFRLFNNLCILQRLNITVHLYLFGSVVSDARGGKNKTGGPEDDLENVSPINQSVAMAIAGNPFNTLGRNVLVSMASTVKFSRSFVIVNMIRIIV